MAGKAHLPDLPFLVVQLDSHLCHQVCQLLLRPAHGFLIRDLVERAVILTPLPVHAPDAYADPAHVIEHGRKFLPHGQGGQMYNSRCLKTGAYIGGEGGEISVFLVKGIGKPGVNVVVQLIRRL